MKTPMARASSRPEKAAVRRRASRRLTTSPPTPKRRRPAKSSPKVGAVAKVTAPTNMRPSERTPTRRGSQRSTARPTAMARNTAGTLMAPISSPTLKCDRPKRATSSGTSGGTTKKVEPMAKKLKTEESRINQRRSAREEVVVMGRSYRFEEPRSLLRTRNRSLARAWLAFSSDEKGAWQRTGTTS